MLLAVCKKRHALRGRIAPVALSVCTWIVSARRWLERRSRRSERPRPVAVVLCVSASALAVWRKVEGRPRGVSRETRALLRPRAAQGGGSERGGAALQRTAAALAPKASRKKFQ